MIKDLAVYLDEKLALYGFGNNHPFSNERFFAFQNAFLKMDRHEEIILANVTRASDEELALFHTRDYINFVKKISTSGTGFLDSGDTPAFKGIFEVACDVVGTTLNAAKHIALGNLKRAFIPIAGLHHARREGASGFCVFNDIGVAIEALRSEFNIKSIAYVDIDVHHGDGVFYGFEDDPTVIFADIHEEGIFPGTGFSYERGTGKAQGRKLNIPVTPGSGDKIFFEEFDKILQFIKPFRPEFIILQCGADSIKNDLLGGLNFSKAAHAHATKELRKIAETYAQGRLLALGGGGYNLNNIASAWTAVVSELL